MVSGRVGALVLVLVLAAGCSGRTVTAGDGSSSTGGEDSTGPAPATSSSTGGTTAPGTDASTESSGSDAASSTGCIENHEGIGASCNNTLQDCPAGQKCVWLPVEGDIAMVCVAVDCDGNDAGEACERDPRTSADNCSATTFCATYNWGTTGYCADLCLPDFACADPTKVCVGSAGYGEYGCFPSCDPLGDACPPMTACAPAYPSFDDFVCFPSSGENAAAGEACVGATDCAPGHACVEPAVYGPGCDFDAWACCTEYCDLDGGRCSNPLHECRPFLSTVGQCVIPDDFDWCDGSVEPPPGYCPPPDAEPNFPWCSSHDDSACPGDAVHLGGGHCWCVDECASLDECPIPETGTGTPACDPEFGCTVLCADDSDCPNGMDCFYVDDALRCLWLPDAG